MGTLIDLTGQRFGRLTVIERAGSDKWGSVLWAARCDCGAKRIVALRSRVTNPNHISVCDRWQGSEGFQHFLEDMGERPEGMSIDRIDPNGHYEPANCRWVDTKTQQANRRPRRRKVAA